MISVQYLELAGGTPSLRAGSAGIEEVLRALENSRLEGPRVLLLEFTPASAQPLDWSGINRLRLSLLQLLDERLADRLGDREALCLEVSHGIEEVESTFTTLRSNARRKTPALMLDISLPSVPTQAREFSAQLSTWRSVLSERSDEARHRLIERAPPMAPHAASVSREVLSGLLADDQRFMDSATVRRALAGASPQSDPTSLTSRARMQGQIFGVWDGKAYCYPAFQFDRRGLPLADTPELVSVLPRDADGSGRDAVLWLFAPDAALDERTPAEVFPTEPRRVIALARERRDGTNA